jgi:hypothetical protein
MIAGVESEVTSVGRSVVFVIDDSARKARARARAPLTDMWRFA